MGCGGASIDPNADANPSSNGGASNGGASSGGSASSSSSGGTASGGSAGSNGGAPWEGTDAGKVNIGECVFEDQGVELQVRYQILQADKLDGALDGSVGPEAVTYLDVSKETLALSGLECLANLEELRLSLYRESVAPVSLTPIAGLSQLRALWLYGPFEFSGALDGLSLESLSLAEVALTDLEEVAAQTGLRRLWLDGVPLTSLTGAQQLVALESLRIDGSNLTDLSPLAATSNLTDLEIRDIPGLTSLVGIEPHTRLEQLLSYDTPIASLVPLTGATDLQTLTVWTSKVSSLEGLEGKAALSSLTVRDSQVSDLSPLSGLPALGYLSLLNNAIDDLSPLSTCTALYTLEVAGNSLQSLAPVAPLVELIHLHAARNELTAIDVDLPHSLTYLSIANNPITSLTPLAGHTLESLDISSTILESLAPLFELPELQNLYANDIGATDLDAFPLAKLGSLSAQNNQIESVAALYGLGDLSVDLTGNEIVGLPADFVGPLSACGGLVLLDNPLDDAAKARLQFLCDQGGGSFYWDGGECDACPRV
jgi:Leucine-rich repeat (LRR) protein